MAGNQRTWWTRHFRRLGQPRRSTEARETAGMFPSPSRSICPCSSCASPRSSVYHFDDVGSPRFLDYFNELDVLGRKFRGIKPTGWFRGFRRSWNESSTAIPLTTELVEIDTLDLDLEAEHARITTELSVIQNLRGYHLDMMFRAQAYNEGIMASVLRENERLKVRERRLIRQLEDLEREMDNVDTITASQT
jgi:hypothetical protein